MEKRGVISLTLLCRKMIRGIYEGNKDTIQGVYHDEQTNFIHCNSLLQ